jgi:phosphoglycolate phosphatase-like HAD superfamily hydrolase
MEREVREMSGAEPVERTLGGEWLVVTDLDGTLIDSEGDNFKFLVQLIEDFGLKDKKGPILKGLAEGKDFDAIMKDIDMSPTTRKAMEDSLRSHLTQAPTPSLPGAIERLKYLRGLGLLFSIATDNYSTFVEKVLRDNGLEEVFDKKLILASDNHKARKPSSDIIDELKRRSGRNKVLIVGNTPKEVALARNACCPAVIICDGRKDKKGTIGYEIEAFGEASGESVRTVKDWEGVSDAILNIISKTAPKSTILPTLEDFLDLSDAEVSAFVTSSTEGRVGVLVPDGNRKAGLVLWGLDPSKKDFDKDLFNGIHSKFMTVVKSFYESGVRTLFIPLLMHTNFDRGKAYMEAAMSDGLNHLFIGEDWLSFYEEFGIRVRFYGDLGYVKDRGYDKLITWMEALEERTGANNKATLFFGVACNRSKEEVRLVQLGMEHHARTGTQPTKEDLISAYYGTDVPEVGFFVRPTEVRDSDVQPILVSASRTQMYFPVCPMILLTKTAVRTILFDLIFNRVASGGKKMYSASDLSTTKLIKVREYYLANMEKILGVGQREGPFWLPTDGTNDKKKEIQNK